MARGKGKGQQFDALWRRFNELDGVYWCGTREITSDLLELKAKTQAKEPKSDYEIKDKRCLMDQINLLLVKEKQKQKELAEN